VAVIAATAKPATEWQHHIFAAATSSKQQRWEQ
jgi:hypothetical protein